jgi:hypothetical protein
MRRRENSSVGRLFVACISLLLAIGERQISAARDLFWGSPPWSVGIRGEQIATNAIKAEY